ncbi:MAG: glycoside hydrolase [Actinomycetota bacterium]|nr:glycoside hydrolase [Actinomycetota bacterium]
MGLATGALALPCAAAADPPLVRLSGPTPFPSGCAGVTSQPTRDAEGEPHLAVDPRDPEHLVATWQQDRFQVYGGALSNLVAVSHDAGATWTPRTVARVSRCTGGADERTSDPWLAFGPDGSLLLASLTFNNDASGQLSEVSGEELAGATALQTSRSADGGATFAPPVRVIDQGLYDDREALAFDSTRPGRAYTAWVRRYGALGESGLEMLATSTDGGRTWGGQRPIYVPATGFFTDPTLLLPLPDGSLLNVFFLDNGSFALPEPTPTVPWDVMAMRSTDGGVTWGNAVRVATVQPWAPRDPDSGADVRAIPLISLAAAADGTVYVAYNERPGRRVYDQGFVRVARSTDGGASWGAPVTVAQVRGQTFLPALAVAGDGTVGVLWDDTRNDRPGDNQFTGDVWLARSGDRGATWREEHVAGPFDLLTGPRSGSAGIGGIFVGDYQAMVGLSDGFGAIFAAPKPMAATGPSDVFFARLTTTPAGGRAAAPRIGLAVRPSTGRVGRLTRFRFTATAPGADGRRHVVARATIRLGRNRARTDRNGHATIATRFLAAGRKRAYASKPGYRGGTTTLRIARPTQPAVPRRQRLTG